MIPIKSLCIYTSTPHAPSWPWLSTWTTLIWRTLPFNSNRMIVYAIYHLCLVSFLFQTEWPSWRDSGAGFRLLSATPGWPHPRDLFSAGPERQFTLFKEISQNVSLIRSGFRFQLQVVSSLGPTAAGLVPRQAPSLQAKNFWFSLESELGWIPVSAWYHHGSLLSRKAARN
jgi:hypothetical protein